MKTTKMVVKMIMVIKRNLHQMMGMQRKIGKEIQIAVLNNRSFHLLRGKSCPNPPIHPKPSAAGTRAFVTAGMWTTFFGGFSSLSSLFTVRGGLAAVIMGLLCLSFGTQTDGLRFSFRIF